MPTEYKYTTTKAFKGSIGEGHEFTFNVPSTLAETTDASVGGGTAYYPDEQTVLAKANAQLAIAAVHRASAWAIKENEKRQKAGQAAVTPAEVQDKIRGFRFGELRVRSAGEAGKTTTKELRTKARAADEAKAKLLESIKSGSFPAAAIPAMVSAGSFTAEDLATVGYGVDGKPLNGSAKPAAAKK